MAVYAWCTLCKSREESCPQQDSHRAQGKIRWRMDFLLGGRYGKRIRKAYPAKVTKKEVETYEALAIADFARGKELPQTGSKSKILYGEYIENIYVVQYVNVRMRGAAIEKYRFKTSVEMWGNRPISQIKHEDAESYVFRRIKEGRKKSAVNREIGALKVAFRWAVDNGYITENPFSKIKKFKIGKTKKRWLTEPEINRLKTAAIELGDQDLADLIVVGVNTGFRKSNLKELDLRNVSGDRIWAFHTKSGDDYSVPISTELKEVLDRRAMTGTRLLNFTNLRKRWLRLVQHCGMYVSRGNPDNVTPHTLKHTFVTRLLNKGIPVEYVSKWANHHSVDFTLENYWHPSENIEAALMKRLDSPGSVDTLMTPKSSGSDTTQQNS